MKVRVLKDHSSAIGPKRAKHKGDEFVTRAEDAQAFMDSGHLAEVATKAETKPK